MIQKIDNLFACPNCKIGIKRTGDRLKCNKCGKIYKMEGEIPIFLDKLVKNESISVGGYRSRLEKYPLILKLHSILGSPDTTYIKKEDYKGNKVEFPLKEILRENDLKLNIGSSSKKVYSNTINLDIGKYENDDVVADGKNLPFKDNSFDLILLESVLEHVDEAEKVINESYRVLKKGGKIYISLPFVFAFHGSPNDFNRYTINGLTTRLEHAGFKIENKGIISGPSSTLNQVLRYYLALLFSFNNDLLFSILLNFFGWLTFPIKYLDILLMKHKKADIIASLVFAIGKK